MSAPLLEVRNASVRFGATTALDALDLDVAEGEVLAVVGPSGSGKSTLLRAVAGLQPLDDGSISLGGRSLAGVPPHRREVGLMFQDHALFPHRDVAGNVGFGPRMAGADRATVHDQVRRLLTLVDLEGYDRRAIDSLSGGEQQRVALARALAASPRLLLLDEPLGALDRPLRERLAADVRRIARSVGLTVVAVTHDHREAFTLADRVAVMDAGRLLQVDAPAVVWRTPSSRRVAEVLGLPNLVRIDAVGGQAMTPWGPLAVPLPDGPGAVLIPFEALSLDDGTASDGAGVSGVVESSTFQGDRTILRVRLRDGTLLEVPSPTVAADVGQTVRVRAKEAQMVPLPH